MAQTETEQLSDLLNLRFFELDAAIQTALEILNRIRALHGKKALTPEDFLTFYRGQRLKVRG